MYKYRVYVLPVAIVLGLVFHHLWAQVNAIVPYIIFTILLLNFVAVDIRKMYFKKMYIWLMLFQTIVSIGCYVLLSLLRVDHIIAEGIFVGVLCPVASSVVVVACMLGANRETVTGYTIWGNILVAVLAPICFSFIGLHQDMPFLESFWLILRKIAPVIVFPLLLALCLQAFLPKVSDFLCKYRSCSFYLWACALLLVLGKTFDFIFLHGKGHVLSIILLGILSALFCAIQFGFGKWLGKKYGEEVAGGQLLGQKNTAFGIWMANVFLSPLSSVFMAFYSIWQNLFNSWQLYRHDKKAKF